MVRRSSAEAKLKLVLKQNAILRRQNQKLFKKFTEYIKDREVHTSEEREVEETQVERPVPKPRLQRPVPKPRFKRAQLVDPQSQEYPSLSGFEIIRTNGALEGVSQIIHIQAASPYYSQELFFQDFKRIDREVITNAEKPSKIDHCVIVNFKKLSAVEEEDIRTVHCATGNVSY